MMVVDSKMDFDTYSMKIKGELRVGYKGLDRRGGIQYTAS